MKHWLFIFALWGILAGVNNATDKDAAESEHYLLETPVVEEIEEVEEEIEEEVIEILEDKDNEYSSTIKRLDLSGKGIEGTGYAFVKDNFFYAVLSVKESTGTRNSFLRKTDIATGKASGKDLNLKGDFMDVDVKKIVPCGEDGYIAVVESADDGKTSVYLVKYSDNGKVSYKVDLAEAADASINAETLTGLASDGGFTYVAIDGQVLVFDEAMELSKQIIPANTPRICLDKEGLAYYIESGKGALYAYNPSIERSMDVTVIEGGNAVFGGDKNEVFVSDGRSIYACDYLYKTATRLFDFADVDISAVSFDDVYKDAEGNLNFVFDKLVGRDYLTPEGVTDVYYIATVTGTSVTEDSTKYAAEIEAFNPEVQGESNIYYFAEDGLLYSVVSVSDKKNGLHDVLRTRDALTYEQIGEDVDISKSSKTMFATKIAPAGDKGYVFLGYDYENDTTIDVLAKIGTDGALIKKKNLYDILGYSFGEMIVMSLKSDGTYIYVSYLPTTGDEQYFSKTVVLDENLNVVKTLGTNASSVCMGGDNLVYLLDAYNECLSSYNPVTGELKENLVTIKFADSIYRGAKDEIFVCEYECLSSYNITTGRYKKLFNFSELGLTTSFVESVFRGKDGSIHVVYEDYAGDNIGVKIAHIAPAKENVLDAVSRTVTKKNGEKREYSATEDTLSTNETADKNPRIINVYDGIMYAVVMLESEENGKKTYHDYYRTYDVATGEQIGEDVLITDELNNYNLWNMFRTSDGGFVASGDAYENLSQYDCIVRISKDGKVLKAANVTEIIKSFGNYSIVMGTKFDGAYTYIPLQAGDAAGGYQMVIVLDENFEFKRILVTSYNVDVAIGSDNLVYVLDGYNGKLSVYEPSSDTILELKSNIGVCFGMYSGDKDELLIEGSEDEVFCYKPKEGTVTKLFDYKSLGIEPYYLTDISCDAYGAIHMVYATKTGSGQLQLAHIVRTK
ncbi:MAG: hypothetical protein K5679_13795 [Lachnospiraceae bacterium]|nr:hypothetical protein [Lachnospiraceae bacterium]